MNQIRNRRMEPVYVKRRQRFIAVTIASLILIIGAIIYIGVATSNRTPHDYEGSGNGVVQLVEIPEGSSISELGPELEERDIVATNSAFQTAASNNPNAGSVQPGFYRLQEQMNAAAAVSALLDPDNQVDLLDIHGGATLMDVTVVGGNTRAGIYSQIAVVTCTEGSANCITAEDLQQVASTVSPAELGVPDWAIAAVEARGTDPKRLEGLINQFGTSHGKGLASDQLEEIGQAAVQGRVATLLVEAERQIPGRVDKAEGKATPAEDEAATTPDLLDELTIWTLEQGGEVIVVPLERMPTQSGAAAIYRF